MVFGEEELALSDLRAVNANYPLKGSIKVAPQVFGVPTATNDSPMKGEWVMEVDWVKHESLK